MLHRGFTEPCNSLLEMNRKKLFSLINVTAHPARNKFRFLIEYNEQKHVNLIFIHMHHFCPRQTV